MDKRYQVFVSSTYADLKEERAGVIQALMEMDCIPAEMETFTAMDDEQMKFIKRVIDDCDYYILIIGGRYGSLSESGLSYTEMEYEYAVEKELSVLAFIHESPGEISASKTELQPELRLKLDAFRDRVKTNRLVKFWKSADQLPGLVALSLSKTIKIYPAIGWVRGNMASNPELLNELNEIRKDNERLKLEIAQLNQQFAPQHLNLASLDETFDFKLIYETVYHGGESRTTVIPVKFTWNEILSAVGPILVEVPRDYDVQHRLGKVLYRLEAKKVEAPYGVEVADDDFHTIRTQLEAYGLISLNVSNSTKGGTVLHWQATERGKSEIAKLRTVKAKA